VSAKRSKYTPSPLEPYGYVLLGMMQQGFTTQAEGRADAERVFRALMADLTPLAKGRLRAAIASATETNIWWVSYQAAQILAGLLEDEQA
jgi:hypothetical protein